MGATLTGHLQDDQGQGQGRGILEGSVIPYQGAEVTVMRLGRGCAGCGPARPLGASSIGSCYSPFDSEAPNSWPSSGVVIPSSQEAQFKGVPSLLNWVFK